MHAAAAAAGAPRARHYPPFRELRAQAGRPLPDYVEAEFDAYLECGRFEEGFLRLRCEQCHAGSAWCIARSRAIC